MIIETFDNRLAKAIDEASAIANWNKVEELVEKEIGFQVDVYKVDIKEDHVLVTGKTVRSKEPIEFIVRKETK